MVRRISVIGLVFVVIVLVGSWFVPSPTVLAQTTKAPASAAPTLTPTNEMVWRFVGGAANRKNPITEVLDLPFCNEVNQKSGGRLKLNFYLATEVGYSSAVLRPLKAGAVEIAAAQCGANAGDMPILGVFELPTFFNSPEQLAKGYEATEAIWKRELAKWDIVPLGYYVIEEMVVLSKKPVNTLKDFDKLKIRAYYAELADLLKALGASTVYVPFPEQYTALQRGTIDATVTGPMTAVALSFWEVINHCTYGMSISYAPVMRAVSKTHFDKLPPDLQKIIIDAGNVASARSVKLANDMLASDLQTLKAKGVTVVKVSNEDRERIVQLAQQQVWPNWRQRVGSVGEELMDTMAKAIR